MKTTEKRMVEAWEQEMKKAGHEFAMIRTKNAIYDRVTIVTDLPTMLIVQFPKGNSRNKNSKSIHSLSENFTIKQENIAKRDVKNLRYYKS